MRKFLAVLATAAITVTMAPGQAQADDGWADPPLFIVDNESRTVRVQVPEPGLMDVELVSPKPMSVEQAQSTVWAGGTKLVWRITLEPGVKSRSPYGGAPYSGRLDGVWQTVGVKTTAPTYDPSRPEPRWWQVTRFGFRVIALDSSGKDAGEVSSQTVPWTQPVAAPRVTYKEPTCRRRYGRVIVKDWDKKALRLTGLKRVNEYRPGATVTWTATPRTGWYLLVGSEEKAGVSEQHTFKRVKKGCSKRL